MNLRRIHANIQSIVSFMKAIFAGYKILKFQLSPQYFIVIISWTSVCIIFNEKLLYFCFSVGNFSHAAKIFLFITSFEQLYYAVHFCRIVHFPLGHQ